MSTARIASLDKLHPVVKEKTLLLIEKVKEAGLRCGVFETYRTFERSDMVYNQGTGVKGGDSYHNYGLAVDFVFKDENDKWTWNSPNWDKLGVLGELCGFEWGGRWKQYDAPHFQYTFGLTIKDLKSGKTPPEVTPDDVANVKLRQWADAVGIPKDTPINEVKLANNMFKYFEKNYS